MRRALVLLPLSVLLLVGCAPPPDAPAPVSPAPTTTAVATSTPSWATEMLGRINAERSAAGAAPLTLCPRLVTAAQRHSEDQAANSRMSHTGSNGSTMSQRVQAAGYLGWTSLGENVAAGYPSVTSVMGGWMGSTGHRANLLSASFQHVGVGRAASGSGTLYWTQNFGRSGSC
jgi:uncharacterized protein YkwD